MADQAGDSVDPNQPVDDTQTRDTAAADTARSFTQADVDRIVQDRLKRQAAQFAGYDDLKAKAEQFDQIQAQNQTDLEKAQNRLAELERQNAAATARAQDFLIRSAIVSEAAKRSVVDPDAAVALIDRSTLEFDDDGHPTNIAQAMDSLLEARSYLVAPQATTRGSADQGARNGGRDAITREQLRTMTPAEIVKAQNEGRLDHLLQGSA